MPASTFELVFHPNNTASWLHDGRPIGSELSVSGATAKSLGEIRLTFQAIFDRPGRPVVDPEMLRSLGRILHDTFFKPIESDLPSPSAGGSRTLFIRSADPAMFNLPWELVWLPGKDLPIGCDPTWAILRVPGAPCPASAPDPGPVRLLFLAAAPSGGVPLDFEKEEDAMLRATQRLKENIVVLPFAETGGLDELAKLVAEHRPHVVHLSGHGNVDASGVGTFLFENERGQPDPKSATDLVSRAFLGNGVRCVFLNACKTGLAATTGLAGHFVTNGVPIVLGWGASVADDMATQFAEAFYQYLAAGDRIPAATAKARQDIWRAGQRGTGQNAPWDATFALARLYATGPDADLIDRSAPSRKYEGPKTEPMLLGDEIKGLREGFVGRRREQQQLIPPFREGVFSVLVLTGMGGMGKSTLATRTANRLKADGFGIHAIKAGQYATPAEAGRWFLLEKLLPALARPFMKEEPATYEAICNGKYPVSDRVNLAVEEWSKRKLLLVMDNFEDVLNPDNTIADPDLRAAFHILTRNLTGGSRLLVTCRYRPDDTPDDLSHICVHGVPEMREFELRKFLRREPKVEARMRSGEIKDDLIHRLHALFGGTPGFLVSVRAWLSKGDISDWEDKIPADTPLEEKRQAYCEKIMLPKLFALLSEPSQRMASLLAVSELPLPADGLARLTGQSPDNAQEAADEAANYGLVQRFTDTELPVRYQTPGLIRGWLSGESRLSPPDRKAADGMLAKFWKKCYEEDREKELQVAVDVELLACRTHARRAEQNEEFQWATYRLSRRLARIAEWREARKLLMEIPEAERDGQVWHSLASINVNERKHAEARAGFAKALAITQTVGDRVGEAAAWHQLATIDVNEGRHAEARAGFAKALAITQAIGNRAGEAVAWHNLASIDLNEGNHAEARAGFAKVLAMQQAIGDRAKEAAAWHQLATIDINEGRHAEARAGFAKALAIQQVIGDRAGEAATWHNLASIDLNEGRHTEARAGFAKALAIKQAISDWAGEADSWHQLAIIDMDERRHAEARAGFAKALAIRQAVGDRTKEAAALHSLATIDMREGKYAEARAGFAKALAIKQAVGDRVGEAATWHQLATIDMREGKYAEARAGFVKALAMRQAVGDRAGEATTWYNLATIDVDEGKHAEARAGFTKALAIRQAVGDRAGEASVWHQLGFVAWKSGEKARGAKLAAICYLIDRDIGHDKSDSDLKNLLWLCGKLGYQQVQIQELLKSTQASYQEDGGKRLLAEAFGSDQ